MSNAASNAHAFYRDVAKHGKVYTVYDDGGYPAPKGTDGQRAQPFWSTRARVEAVIAISPAYMAFKIEEVSWQSFISEVAPGLVAANLRVGVNWSGPRAQGYDLEPDRVIRAVDLARANTESEQ